MRSLPAATSRTKFHDYVIVKPDFPGIRTSPAAYAQNYSDVVPTFLCRPCFVHFRKTEELPHRRGTVDGKYRNERDYALVNEAWFAAGHPPQCHNEACKASLKDKMLYGLEMGIRCERCQVYRYDHDSEWHPDTRNPAYDLSKVGYRVVSSICSKIYSRI